MNIPLFFLTLCDRFPCLCKLCPIRNASINFCPSSSSSNLHWNFNFERNLNDREIQNYASLLELFNDIDIDEMKQHKRLWSLETSGHYSCKSYLNWLINDVSLADCFTLQKRSGRLVFLLKFKSFCGPCYKKN